MHNWIAAKDGTFIVHCTAIMTSPILDKPVMIRKICKKY